jgi:F-type H+-transporting ATPase subunit b
MSTLAFVVLAVEEGTDENLQLLPATAELIWGLVAFSITAFFIMKFAWPRMSAVLDERGARIQGQLEQAESTRQEAEELRRRYEQQLADARNQADEIIDDGRKQGERVRAEIVGNAEDEASQILARAQEEAESVRARLLADLRGQVAVASVELAGKIVQRELDPERHRALVDQYINELSGLN